MEKRNAQVGDTQGRYCHTALKNKSTFNPKTNNQYIEVFKSMVQQDVKEMRIKKDRKTKKV